MIHEMYHGQCMILNVIHIIFVSMIICSDADHFIITYTWRKKTSIKVWIEIVPLSELGFDSYAAFPCKILAFS